MTTRFETFSFLPPLSPAQAQAQAEELLRKKLVPTIEFSEGNETNSVYWQHWPVVAHDVANKRLRAGDVNASLLMMQIEACARRHPYALVRLNGYQPNTQTTAMSFIVKIPHEGS